MVSSRWGVVAADRSRSSGSHPSRWAFHSTERGHSYDVTETSNVQGAYSDEGEFGGYWGSMRVKGPVAVVVVAAAAAVAAIVTAAGE